LARNTFPPCSPGEASLGEDTGDAPNPAGFGYGTAHVAYLKASVPSNPGTPRDDYYLYDVTFDGETIVAGSRVPECGAARVLLARGVIGSLAIIDADTGKHRTTLNIEAAAKLTVWEGRRQLARFAKWKPYATDVEVR
jgi:hypothetical protein